MGHRARHRPRARGLSGTARLHPKARFEKHGVEVERDIPYTETGSADHLLDVYRPVDRRGELPVIMYVHGGGFSILSKDTHWMMGLAFARRGYVVFSINYRLAPRHRYPAAIEDSCRALVWVVKNAHRWGGDASRLALAGESAGGNLVTSLTIAACSPRPEPWARDVFDCKPGLEAVMPACGMLQVTDAQRLIRSGVPRWIGERIIIVSDGYLPRTAHTPEQLELADPLLVLERGGPFDRPLPSFFATVGDKDPLMDDTLRLKRALDAIGTPCECRVYPGGIHAFHALLWKPRARECWRDHYDFLERRFPSAPA